MNKLKYAKTKLGNEIYLTGNEKAKTLIIGVFHGDEPQGKYLIEEYVRTRSLLKYGSTSDAEPECMPILFIPCLNPDGMKLNQRTNANGVDLNRNFPTNNWKLSEKNNFYGGDAPASEIETQFVIEIIEQYSPEIIVTLHAPYKVVNFDGPAQELSEQISKIINYPVEPSIGYPTPGSFGTYTGIERNIKTITLELDEICPVEDLISPVHKIFDLFL